MGLKNFFVSTKYLLIVKPRSDVIEFDCNFFKEVNISGTMYNNGNSVEEEHCKFRGWVGTTEIYRINREGYRCLDSRRGVEASNQQHFVTVVLPSSGIIL